jgi:hypothetical protein
VRTVDFGEVTENGLRRARALPRLAARRERRRRRITFSNLPESLQTIARLYGVHACPADATERDRSPDVEKRYGSALRALAGVSLAVEEGEFFGLLGRTARQDHAHQRDRRPGARRRGQRRASWAPTSCRLPRARRRLGVVPQELVFDPFFTVRETLRIQSGYYGIRGNDAWIDEVMHHLDLTAKADVNMRALSGGMKRRVLVAQALVHKPPVIVLDEPTAASTSSCARAVAVRARAQPRRPHHRPHHALPRGSRAALQPHRHAQGRPHRRARLDDATCSRASAARAPPRAWSRATARNSRSSSRLRRARAALARCARTASRSPTSS